MKVWTSEIVVILALEIGRQSLNEDDYSNVDTSTKNDGCTHVY